MVSKRPLQFSIFFLGNRRHWMFFGTMTIDINGFSMFFLVLQPLFWLTSMVFKSFNNFFGTIDINCFSMVFKSFNHWFHRFSMVRDHWSNDDHKCSPFGFRFITITRSLGDLRALTSSWRPIGPLDFVHFLDALASLAFKLSVIR